MSILQMHAHLMHCMTVTYIVSITIITTALSEFTFFSPYQPLDYRLPSFWFNNFELAAYYSSGDLPLVPPVVGESQKSNVFDGTVSVFPFFRREVEVKDN
jgi:hypothetical protein